jgi:predicted dienelactone hydrolase
VTPDAATPDVAEVAGTPLEALGTLGVGVLTVQTAGADGRVLPTEIWYPAPLVSAGEPAEYVGGLIASKSAQRGVPPAAGGPFPVIVFSHGNSGLREQSVFFAEHMAAHGYVVVAPDHVGNTVFDFDEAKLAKMFIWRPKDVAAALDRVLTPKASDPKWLQGLADGERAGVAGHSFGGYTALAAGGGTLVVEKSLVDQCIANPNQTSACPGLVEIGAGSHPVGDPRFKAILAMAPGAAVAFGVGQKGLADVSVPVMVQAGSGDTTTPLSTEAKPVYKALSKPKYLAVLQGAQHFTFTNICDLAYTGTVPKSILTICEPGFPMTIAEAHPLINQYGRAFFDVHLAKSSDPQAKALLSPASPLPPKLTLEADD